MIPQANQIYRHFKGNLYRIVTMAEHSETGEQMVVYQALYGEYRVYTRPLTMFMEPIDKVKYPDADQKIRFELVKEIASVKEKFESENAAIIDEQMNADAERTDCMKKDQSAQTQNEETTMNADAEKTNYMKKDQSAQTQNEEMTMNADAEKTDYMKKDQSAQIQNEEMTMNAETASQPTLDTSSETGIDPLLEAYLDTDSYRERLNILHCLHHRITDNMINTMAIVMDVEIPEGDIETRYEALHSCLLTREKYECSRLG